MTDSVHTTRGTFHDEVNDKWRTSTVMGSSSGPGTCGHAGVGASQII